MSALAHISPTPSVKGSPGSFLADTWLLLSLRRQVGWNSFKARKPTYKVFTVLGGLIVFLFFASLSSGAGVLAGTILRHYPELQLGPVIPGLILTAVALFLVFGSFGTALGSLFLSSDLELLMTAPVNRRAVFVSKILDGIVWNYVLVAALAAPALLTYGLGLQYGPLYYILALIALIGTPLLPAALGAVLVLIVARFAPARRVREVLGLMGALFGLGCGVLGQTGRFWVRSLAGANSNPEDLLRRIQGVVALPFPPFMAGRGLEAAGRNDFVGAFANLTLFLLLTFGLFALCVYGAEYMYASGWVRMQSSGSAKRSKQRAEQAARRSGWLGKVPSDVAIALKDWKVIPRDLRNFAQMLAPLIFWPIVYINLTTDRGGRSQVPGFFDSLGGVLVAAGVLGSTVMLMGNIAYTSISREGKSWWLLRAAPLSGLDLVRGKFLAVEIPFAILSTLLMLVGAVWRQLDPLWSFYGWLGVETLGAGMLAVAVALSIPWARLDWEDPRRMNSGWGSILSLATWLAMALVCGGFLCLPLLAEATNPGLTPLFALAGLAISATITAAVAYLALKFGESRLPEA